MSLNDHIKIRTKVQISELLPDGSAGKVLDVGHNLVTIAGAGFLTRKIYSAFREKTDVTPSYNDELGLDNNFPTPVTDDEFVYLFAIGTGGCGKEPYQKYEPQYLSWIKPENLIPFKYLDIKSDLPDSLRDTYYGRCERTNKIIYYFKTPENISNPEMVQQYEDGTPIDSHVYKSAREDDSETRVQLHLKVTKDEAKQFFRDTTGINTARVNQISLLTAFPKQVDGIIYYQNIRPFTLYNFNSIPLIDEELGIDIKYDLYF